MRCRFSSFFASAYSLGANVGAASGLVQVVRAAFPQFATWYSANFSAPGTVVAGVGIAAAYALSKTADANAAIKGWKKIDADLDPQAQLRELDARLRAARVPKETHEKAIALASGILHGEATAILESRFDDMLVELDQAQLGRNLMAAYLRGPEFAATAKAALAEVFQAGFQEAVLGLTQSLAGVAGAPPVVIEIPLEDGAGGLSELRFGRRWIERRIGDDEAWNRLLGFLDGKAGLEWTVLHGPGGSGKSRLALELCMTASAQGWNAGFLDSDLNAQLGKLNPEKPTLVVVDYSGSKLATVRNLLAALRGADSAPVRVLLLDRYYSDSTTLGKEARDAARRQPWVPDGIRCGLLSVDDFVAIAGRAYWLSEGRELSPAQKRGVREALDKDQWKKRTLRPLYAIIVGRILAERPGDGLETIVSEDLFDYVVEHEARQWRMAGVTPADVNVSVLATLAGGLSANSVPSGDCTKAHDAGRAARVASHSYSDGYYPPLDPDLVGSAFVVARWRGGLTIGDETPEQARKCCEGMVAHALAKHAESAARTLGWIAEGYGKEDDVAEWLRGQGMPDSVKAAVTAARGEKGADAAALRAQFLQTSALAESLMARGEVRLAAEHFDSAHRLAEQLLAAVGNDDPQARRDLSVSWSRVGDARAALGDAQGALDAYNESLALTQALAAERPDDPEARRDLSASWNKVGVARAALGDWQGTLGAYNKSLALCQALAAERPGDPQARRDLSVAWVKVGKARAALGDAQRALEAYSESHALRQALADERPGDPEARRDLFVSN